MRPLSCLRGLMRHCALRREGMIAPSSSASSGGMVSSPPRQRPSRRRSQEDSGTARRRIAIGRSQPGMATVLLRLRATARTCRHDLDEPAMKTIAVIGAGARAVACNGDVSAKDFVERSSTLRSSSAACRIVTAGYTVTRHPNMTRQWYAIWTFTSRRRPDPARVPAVPECASTPIEARRAHRPSRAISSTSATRYGAVNYSSRSRRHHMTAARESGAGTGHRSLRRVRIHPYASHKPLSGATARRRRGSVRWACRGLASPP